MTESEFRYHKLDIENEKDFESVKDLIGEDLSEPYSIYIYRFFLNQWPDLCYLVKNEEGTNIGTIICKIEPHREVRIRGYIGMLAVQKSYRGKGLAKKLVKLAIEEMVKQGCDEIMLETEVVNTPAISLYENMGFIRLKRLYRYYLNQHDAYRLILPITTRSLTRSGHLEPLPTNELNVL